MPLRSSIWSLALAPAIVAFAPLASAQTGAPAAAPAAPPPATAPATPPTPATTPAPTTPAPSTTPETPPQADAAGDSTTLKATTEPAGPTEKPVEQRRAVYISVDLGFTRNDIGALSDNTNFDKTAANGLLAGIGIGYRHGRLRFGGRFRDASTTQFNVWSMMGEFGYSINVHPVTPVIFVHGGYMFDSGIQRSAVASALPAGNVLTPNLGLDGAVVGAEVLANLHLSEFLRIGPFIGFDLTWLHRKQVDLPQSIVPLTDDTKNNPLYTGSGSGVGYVFSLGIRGTGDIAF
jgi:hypothetical protein